MSARLIGRTGPAAPTDFVIAEKALLGSAPANDLRLGIEGVSRKHARIWKDGEAYYLEDSGSTNGTFVNGQRVETIRLRHLDVVSLARHVDLIFLESEGPSRVVHGQALQSASIEWLDGPEAGTVIDVPMGETTVGRDWSANVPVDTSVVSKLHVRLVRHGDFLTIQDLGSTNGTTVDGRELQGVVTLEGGETVALGGSVHFRVRLRRDPAAPARTTPRPAVEPQAEVFDQEWRTRLIWSPEELAEIESARARIRAGEGDRRSRDTEVVDEKKVAEELETAERLERQEEAPEQETPAADRTMVADRAMLEAAAERAATPDRESTQVGSMQELAGAAPDEVLRAAGAARAGADEAEVEAAPAADGDATRIGEAPGEAALPEGVAAAARAARGEVEAAPAPEEGEQKISGIRLEGERGSFRLDTGDFLVGRDLAADVWLDGEGVSRKHAMVYVSGHAVEIEDLGSSNGTRADGVAVAGRTGIEDGAVLEFGGATLRLEVLRE